MKDQIFETSFSEVLFFDSVTLVLEVENYLERPAFSWEIYLEVLFLEEEKTSLECVALNEKVESLYFLLESRKILSSKGKRAVRVSVFVEQDLYTRVRVRFFELTEKIFKKELQLKLGNLAPWEEVFSRELKKQTLSGEVLFSLFQVARLLELKSWALLLAKQMEALSAAMKLSSYLEVIRFLDKISFPRQLEAFAQKESFLTWKPPINGALAIQTSEEVGVFLTRGELPSKDKLSEKLYNGRWLVLRTLGVSRIEKSAEIVSFHEQEGFEEVSKPFLSFEDLDKIPLLKQLELDFYLSCQVLEKWRVKMILWESVSDDPYIDFLGFCLRKTFLVS